MNRRRFLKLLGAILLALGLRWPAIEPEPELIMWSTGGSPDPDNMEAYVRYKWGLDRPAMTVTTTGAFNVIQESDIVYDYKRVFDALSECSAKEIEWQILHDDCSVG